MVDSGIAGQGGTGQGGHGGDAGGVDEGGGHGGADVPNYTEGTLGDTPGGGGGGGPSCQNGHAGGGNGADGAVEIFATYVGTNGVGQFEAYCVSS